jgi:hypothetical protein
MGGGETHSPSTTRATCTGVDATTGTDATITPHVSNQQGYGNNRFKKP